MNEDDVIRVILADELAALQPTSAQVGRPPGCEPIDCAPDGVLIAAPPCVNATSTEWS